MRGKGYSDARHNGTVTKRDMKDKYSTVKNSRGGQIRYAIIFQRGTIHRYTDAGHETS